MNPSTKKRLSYRNKTVENLSSTEENSDEKSPKFKRGKAPQPLHPPKKTTCPTLELTSQRKGPPNRQSSSKLNGLEEGGAAKRLKKTVGTNMDRKGNSRVTEGEPRPKKPPIGHHPPRKLRSRTPR